MRWLLVAIVLLHALPSEAQDKAAAEAAFREGRRLMQQKQYEAACPKLEASLRLDPATGTLLNLADCYAKLGRTASAWARFVEVAQRDAASARGREAGRRAAALEPNLMKLVISVESPPSDLRVARDDVDAGALLGVAVPVDPGTHVVRASGGGREWSTQVAATKPGETVTVVIPHFWIDTHVAAPVPEPPALVTTTTHEVKHEASGRKTAAVVVGAAGLVAVGIGLAFGARARSSWDDSRAGCDATNHCTDEAYDQVKKAQRSATISTVLVGVGAGAAVTGGVLWFTARF